jgi:phospholipid/cholesterol/gamma-HCH transport system substrate-binding protein
MNNRMQTIRVGLFFVLGVALLWITFESLTGGRVFGEKGYPLIARFDNLKGLQKGDMVLMAGVRIGTVTGTSLVGRKAQATISIMPDVKIASDAVAMVAQSSLLGTNHLEVTVGSPSAPPLAPGAEIKTQETIGMNEVIARLGSLGDRMEQVVDEIGQTLKGGKGGSLFTKIDTLVTENGPKLTATMSNLQDITTKIRNGDGTLGRLVNDPKLHDELVASAEELKATAHDARTFMTNAQSILDQVKSGKGTLGALLYDEQTASQFKLTAKNISELSTKLNSNQSSLGRLINDDSLYREAQSAMRKVNQAVDSMSDQGPITAVGVAANSLF